MPDIYYNFVFQIIIVILLIAYFNKGRVKNAPEVSNILRTLKNGRFDKAAEVAITKIKSINSDEFTYHQKEMFFMRFRKIIEYLEKKVDEEKDLETLNALGWAYISINEYEKALKYLRIAEDIKCSDFRVNFNIARAMQGMNWHRKSLTYYRKSLVLKPDNIEALIGKGEMCVILEMFVSAKEAYQKAFELDNGNVQAIYGIAVSHFHFEEYEQAKKYFMKLEKNEYNEAIVDYCLGKIFYIEKNYETAIEYLEKATNINYFYAEAYYLKALIYSELKNRDMAIQDVSNAIRIDDSYKESAKNEKLFETYWLYSDFKKLFESN